MSQSPAARRPVEPITGLDELGLSADLITGEAVVLELRPASFATRALALLVDLILQAAVFTAATVVFALTAQGLDAAAVAAVILAIVVSVLVGLPVTIETLTRGRSRGMLAGGVRVVRGGGGGLAQRSAPGQG